MKQAFSIYSLAIISLFLIGCKTTEKTAEVVVYRDSLLVDLPDQMIFHFKKGKAYNHPTFVVWAEGMDETYLRTLFITQSYASGIFGYRMVGDSIWLKEVGESIQPAALPYWAHKKGPIAGDQLVPTPEHPFVDAYTGATPLHDFQFETALSTPEGQIQILLEVNQSWDFNNHWINNKYPDSPAYKHSAQPSIVYATTINPVDSVFYLTPIGHGDPKGESGNLFSDLSTLTTAKEIFESIRITVKH